MSEDYERILKQQNEQAKQFREQGLMNRNAAVHRNMNFTLSLMEGKTCKEINDENNQ